MFCSCDDMSVTVRLQSVLVSMKNRQKDFLNETFNVLVK